MSIITEKCEYNFCCEDYAIDGTSKSWGYNVENNAPAKHEITFFSNNEFTYKVCDGCLALLDGDGDIRVITINRIAPETVSYNGKRGKKYHSHVWKESMRIKN